MFINISFKVAPYGFLKSEKKLNLPVSILEKSETKVMH